MSLPVPNQVANNDDQHQLVEDHYSDRYLSNTDPRKDKWRATSEFFLIFFLFLNSIKLIIIFSLKNSPSEFA